jgi:O-acetyl-ADP-ribose deacetylase (regulator of RNase III)
MITFVKGNIFDSPAQVITNTVNCVGVMGKGLALEFKNRFSTLFEDYKQRCDRGQVRPGEPYLWQNDKVQILNFPTKRHWKDDSRPDDIEAGLRYLAAHYQEMGIYTLALPPLGCGNGNLKWEEVRPLVIKHLGSLEDLEVFVYEPMAKADQKNPWDQDDTQPSYPRPPLAAKSDLPLDK